MKVAVSTNKMLVYFYETTQLDISKCCYLCIQFYQFVRLPFSSLHKLIILPLWAFSAHSLYFYYCNDVWFVKSKPTDHETHFEIFSILLLVLLMCCSAPCYQLEGQQNANSDYVGWYSGTLRVFIAPPVSPCPNIFSSAPSVMLVRSVHRAT